MAQEEKKRQPNEVPNALNTYAEQKETSTSNLRHNPGMSKPNDPTIAHAMALPKKTTTGSIIRENAEIKSDITTVLAVFTDVFKSIGLDMKELSGNEPMHIVAKALPKISMMVASGGGASSDAFAKLKEIVPIIEKYKHLVPHGDAH